MSRLVLMERELLCLRPAVDPTVVAMCVPGQRPQSEVEQDGQHDGRQE